MRRPSVKGRIRARQEWKAVFVEWVDASGPSHNGWTFVGDLEEDDGGYICHSVGWLIRESRTHYTITAHIGNVLHENEDQCQFCGVMHIPKGMVIKLKQVRL